MPHEVGQGHPGEAGGMAERETVVLEQRYRQRRAYAGLVEQFLVVQVHQHGLGVVAAGHHYHVLLRHLERGGAQVDAEDLAVCHRLCPNALTRALTDSGRRSSSARPSFRRC